MKEITRNGDSIHVKLRGDLTSTRNTSFEIEMIRMIQKDSPKELIIDFDEVKMIDSFGIRGLFSINENIGKVNGKLKAVNVSSVIYGLFVNMRLNTHFEISEKKE